MNKTGTFVILPVEVIDPIAVPDPRMLPSSKAQDDADIASIKERGIIEPIIVGKLEKTDDAGNDYVLIAGRRRRRLGVMAGLKELPCIVRPEPATKENINGLYRDIAAEENVHRADMHTVEIAAEVERRAALKHSHATIAKALNIGVSNVSNYSRLARAPFFSAMVERLKDQKPVPSYRKCLQVMALYPSPEGGKESTAAKDERLTAQVKTFEAECAQEERVLELAKAGETNARGVEGEATGRGKAGAGGGGGGATTKPRNWKDVLAYWRAAEATLKSGKLPSVQVADEKGTTINEGRPITEDERAQLVAITDALAWLYGQRDTSPVFKLGKPEKEKKPKTAKAAKTGGGKKKNKKV